MKQAKIFLEKENKYFGVTVTESVEETLGLFDEKEFDAIVSDYKMSKMNGLDFLKIVRNEKESNIPFVILTAKGREEVAMNALNIGANGYVQKKTDPQANYEEIVQVLIKKIENYRALKREKVLHSLLRHDLRNKSQIVRGYLELIKDFAISEEEGKYVEKAIKNIENGIELIEKIQTLRKVGERKTKRILVKPLFKNVISEHDDQALQKGIKITSEECQCKEVKAGPFLQDLVSNIIENAIKHSKGTEIRITCKNAGEYGLIIIEDDGKGIPDERKKKIFEKRFKKGKNAGSGLGLYLVKEIAESYNGSVEVKNSELGGAQFDIYLKKPG